MTKFIRILFHAIVYALVFSVSSGCASQVIIITATPQPTVSVTLTSTPNIAPSPTAESPTPTQELDTHTPSVWDFRTCGIVTARAGLNIRPYPATDNDPITKLATNTSVIIDLSISEDYPQWYYIEVPALLSLEGWVSRAWVSETDCSG